MLSTPVGIIVLSAGVGNDVVGWILLALCVALVNAGSGLTALYVLLTCVAFALFLTFAVRPAFLWILRRENALTEGPSQGIIVLTLMIALGSSFFTGVIGVHAIFGAFMAGLICPHEGGFAIKVTEKIEDLISALFLPLYFALSGLNTDIGLLDDGITWGYTIGVTVVAFSAKFIGASLAARATGMVWRESFTIGALMSCKGLVELIVLNIGLQAKILSTRTFTIFVVMALATTFATTPLTAALYPPWYQRKLEAWKRGEIDWDTGKPIDGSDGDHEIVQAKLQSNKVKSLLVYLRFDNMPTLLAFVSLLSVRSSDSVKRSHPSLQSSATPAQAEGDVTDVQADYPRKKPLQVHGVRLVELTERGSTVMKVSEVDEYSLFDPVLNAFRVLGQIYNLAVSGEVTISPVSSYPDVLVNKATDEASDLLLLPWSETGGLTETQTISNDSVKDKFSSDAYIQFVSSTLETATCNTAVFINKGFSGTLRNRPSTLSRSASKISLRRHSEYQTMPYTDRSHHIFVPFLGGADGRAAIRLALQLAENPEVTATILHLLSSNTQSSSSGTEGSSGEGTVERISVTAGSKAVAESQSVESDSAFFTTMRNSLPAELADRVVFDSAPADSILEAAIERAAPEIGQNPKNGGDIIILGRGSVGDSSTGCLGIAAERVLGSGLRASLLVVLAKGGE